MLSLFLDTALTVVVFALVLGAGLPALFALGLRLSAAGAGEVEGAPAVGGARVAGLVCFALVAVAVALGVLVVVASGLGKEVSFEHVLPTLVPKG